MKTVKEIEEKIEEHKLSIKKFIADSELKEDVREKLIFNMLILINELKWVLKDKQS